MRRGRMRNIVTPCTGLCDLNVINNTCSKCGRTSVQIEEWMVYSHEERVDIIKNIKRENNDRKGI